MSFLFRKVEYVTTISKSQSLTSVGIKDCTLRVPNKTTTLHYFFMSNNKSNLHFKTILRESLRAGPLSGFPSTAPPPVSVSAVLGTLAVRIPNQKKQKK